MPLHPRRGSVSMESHGPTACRAICTILPRPIPHHATPNHVHHSQYINHPNPTPYPYKTKNSKSHTNSRTPRQHPQMLTHTLLPRPNLHTPQNPIVRARRRLQAAPTTQAAPRARNTPCRSQTRLHHHLLLFGERKRRRYAARFPSAFEQADARGGRWRVFGGAAAEGQT